MAQHLWVAWQPIVDFQTGRIVAQEALLRGPQGSRRESPASIFGWAKRTGRMDRVESAARHLAFASFVNVPEDQIVCLNANLSHPEIPLNPMFIRLEAHQVAIEISEQQPIVGLKEITEKVAKWREQGHLIVLDDYGTGYAALGAILALRPNWIKLDRSIIQNLDRDIYRAQVVHDVTALWQSHGILVVAEGIETVEEFEVLLECGVTYGQGYLFSRPQVTALEALPEEIRQKLWPETSFSKARDSVKNI